MSAKRTVPDCTTCGVCCVAMHDQSCFCDLTTQEVARMSSQFRAANVEYSSILDHLIGQVPYAAFKTRWRKMKAGPLKGGEVCACCMLDGAVLKRVRCRIYATRPSVCRRAVKPGDNVCRELRRAFEVIP